MGETSYVEQHRFGRVGRIPTPYEGLGDINSYLILPPPGGDGPVLVDTGVHGDRSWAGGRGAPSRGSRRPRCHRGGGRSRYSSVRRA
jgi:glyoxylase-like metal-dependent hydrolase (beta-lactamase superfamily II)